MHTRYGCGISTAQSPAGWHQKGHPVTKNSLQCPWVDWWWLAHN
jgi:hypothetical protein